MISPDDIGRTYDAIKGYIRRTPVVQADLGDIGASADLSQAVTLKLEQLQCAGSFKARGAFANLLLRDVPPAGVVAASGGNHGVAVAYAASRVGLGRNTAGLAGRQGGVPAKVFVPTVSAPAKIERIRRLGADLVVTGERYADALAAAEQWAETSGALSVHAFDQPETILGQGTLGLELAGQAGELDTVLVPVGGGGLIAGIASWFAGAVRVVGVEPEGAPTLSRARAEGRPADAPAGSVAADALAPRRVGDLVFPITQRYVADVVLVDDDAILAAQQALWQALRVAAEPAASVGIAALLAGAYKPAPGEHVAVVISGANISVLPRGDDPPETPRLPAPSSRRSIARPGAVDPREPRDRGAAAGRAAPLPYGGAVRFVFTPPADHAAGLLSLPWAEPLQEWRDDRLVEIRQRGISRHVVRFVTENGELYALKELSERLARREYRLLRTMAERNIPAVEVVGIAVDRGDGNGFGSPQPDLDAILVTRFLSYATTYRAVFSNPRGLEATDRLLDALVELLVRLHLFGFFWGDCSLSNALFCYDAGALEANLVDAETSEHHPSLTDGQREWDIELAAERVCGELLDLQAGELLPPDVDPLEVAEELRRRYQSLWSELTREEVLRPEEQRFKIAERLARINELGFDVDEVELIPTGDGNKVRLRTRVAEAGHNARQLFLRTGIGTGENLARRLLNDMASFRAYLEQRQGHPVSEVVAANRWLEEVYDPVIAAIPKSLRGRLPPAEIFHEVLEHRWYMSEAAGADVGTTAAARDYFERVLPTAPEPMR
ncbi:MAG: serine/threonine dehydratase [Streptosporangiaceae bacterium]|nr:serine/threonine dehydratase [Streptosporangiaceae bacterium]